MFADENIWHSGHTAQELYDMGCYEGFQADENGILKEEEIIK